MELAIRPVQEADRAAILRGRPRRPLATPAGPEAGAPRRAEGDARDRWDEAAFRWLYEENPAGRLAFVATDDGELLGHAAAVPRRLWAGGKERRFGELVDVFETEPRRGAYALTARALLEERAGDGLTLVHGWPGAAEARVWTRLLGFETVRTEAWLLAAVEPEATDAERGAAAGVERLAAFGEDARWLWDRCSGDFAASTIRDDAYLNWRFFGRPNQRYYVLGLRDEGVLRGYAVLAPAREPATVHLVDWLCPPDEGAVGEALLAAAMQVAREQGAIALGGLIVPWSPWFEWFQRRGFSVHGRGSFLLARTFLRKFDDLWLRDGWWYTLADSIGE